jgi:hypothetical protein
MTMDENEQSGQLVARSSEAANPFGLQQSREAAGSGLALQSTRENAEVLALVASAKRFPRNQLQAAERIRTAFCRGTLAEKAMYQYSRGGSDITGPSIRAAEAMAQQWGNLSSGWREVSRTVGADGVGISELEAYCVDYENTTRRSIHFHVKHWRDTKRGGYALKDERDIYEVCANQAARRERACILSQIPGDVTEMAMDQAAITLSAHADTSPEGRQKLLDAFAEYGVKREHIEAKIQRRLDAIQPGHVVLLKRIYVSLRDDMSVPGDWFDMEPEPQKGDQVTAESLKSRAAKKAAKATAQTAEAQTAAAQNDAGPTISGNIIRDVGPGGVGIDYKTVEPSRSDEQKRATLLAWFRDQVEKANNRDAADLIMDQARGDPLIGEPELTALSLVYRTKWSEA